MLQQRPYTLPRPARPLTLACARDQRGGDRGPPALVPQRGTLPPPAQPSPPPLALARRGVLLAAAAVLAGPHLPAHAAVLRSAASTLPASLLVQNALAETVKVYWVNYDGDAELLALVPPGSWASFDTYEAHSWRVVGASTGATLQEYVAQQGEQVLRLDPLHQAPSSTSVSRSGSSSSLGSEAGQDFLGFDGIGGLPEEYVQCELAEVAVDAAGVGGVALLLAAGYEEPVPIRIGAAEAAQLYYAAGAEFRRPTTVATWAHTLQAAGSKVQRVVITRAVGTMLYARIVLRLPGGEQCSLDSRPSDSLALALQTSAPLFIAKHLARAHQPGDSQQQLAGLVPEPQALPQLRTDAGPPMAAGSMYDHVQSL